MAFKKKRVLGIAQDKTRYDLPLNGASGNGFLVLLVSLMTFLAVLALIAGFALTQITAHWSSGLQNQVTIEIPAEGSGDNIRNKNEIKSLSDEVETKIKDYSFVENVTIMSDEDIAALISPWLGGNFSMEDIPSPGMIALELSEGADIQALAANVKTIDPSIRVDTHEEWLSSILGLIGSLQFSMSIVSLTIAITGITAIAGAIRSRMAEHKPDVELLHLMGASDVYIAKQFQRHAYTLGIKGGVIGVISGGVMIAVFALLQSGEAQGLLPEFRFEVMHVVTFLILPFLICGLTGFTARSTVLHELSRMP